MEPMNVRRLWRFVIIFIVGGVGLWTTGGQLAADDPEQDPNVNFLRPSMLGVVGNGGQGGEGTTGIDEPPLGMEDRTVTQERIEFEEDGALGFFDTVDFGGSLDVSFVVNTQGSTVPPQSQENPTRVFDRFNNAFTVQNLILDMSREANDDHLFGFSFVPAVGADAQVTGGGGFDFGTGNTSNVATGLQSIDIDVYEAYGSFYVPSDVGVIGGTTIKTGKFFSPSGAEVVPSGENAMFSRSFLFGNARPFTHTGLIADKSLFQRESGDNLFSAAIGWSNGWDSLRNTNDGFVLLTSWGFEPVEWTGLTANVFWGADDRLGAGGDSSSKGTLVDLVMPIDMNVVGLAGLSFLLNLDWYGNTNDQDIGGQGYVDYWGFAGIVRWDFELDLREGDTDDFYLAFRGEYDGDPDGFFDVPGAGALSPGSDSHLYFLTWTLGYIPSDFLLLRFELRYDHSDTLVYRNSQKHHQLTFAWNSVFTF